MPIPPRLLAAGSAAGQAADAPLITDPPGVLAALLAALALVFWLNGTALGKRVFGVVPVIVFCYFVPTTLTTLHIIPDESALYSWIKTFVLPASLVLLILALDLPGILRLGPKALIMFLAGTLGVVVGGPIALLLTQHWLPPDAWQGLAALSGSWIGGGANFIALGQIAGTSDELLAQMVVPDVLVANLWMGVLLFLAAREAQVDRWLRADSSSIRALEQRMTEFRAKVQRTPTLADFMIILALGFAGAYLAYAGGLAIDRTLVGNVEAVAVRLGVAEHAVHSERDLETLGRVIDAHLAENPNALDDYPPVKHALYTVGRAISFSIDATTWKFLLVTALGIVLSLTPARRLEGAGASQLGSVMLYLLVACIGASADFQKVVQSWPFFVTGLIWMSIHVVIMVVVAVLIRAPVFFLAVGSKANIGGAASAPVVASAFHPSLAPVGVLLAVAGYVLGTYAGLLCMALLKLVAGV